MLIPKFGTNDKVFAKLRGYPPWPARVDGVADETPNKIKYHVYFYGTGETAVCKQEELCMYVENKEKYGKPMKKRGFNTALAQIDAELGLGPSIQAANFNLNIEVDSSLNMYETPGKSHASTPVTSNKTSSVKRKRQQPEESDRELFPTKARKIVMEDNDMSEIHKSTSTSHQTISRSGRKIKAKKYSDGSEDFEEKPTIGAGLTGYQKSKNIQQPSKSKRPESQKKGNINGEIKTIKSDGIVTTTPDGKNLTLQLNLRKPRYFKGKKLLEQWKAKVLHEVVELKSKVQSGEISVDEIIKKIDVPYNKTLAELEQDKGCPESCDKLNYLKMEVRLIELNMQIRNAATLENPDPDACLSSLDELTSMAINPLMIKKNPEIVDTLKKLTKYVGIKPDCADDEAQGFKEKADAIRAKAKGMCSKIKSFFEIPSGQSFSAVFFQILVQFRKAVKDLTVDELILLTIDPMENSREKSDNILISNL